MSATEQGDDGHHGHGHHGDDDVDPAQFYRQDYWDDRYGGDRIWSGNPNPLLVEYASALTPGTALDAGSGEGGDVIWLAAQGWQVTGADISPVALRRSAEIAAEAGPDIAACITWQQADLLTWAPPAGQFDLVSAQFIHLPTAERESLHRRLAAAVRPGGVLLITSHHPADLDTGQRPNAPVMFATPEQMASVLEPASWAIELAEPPREATFPDGWTGTVRDAVLHATRR
jgi:SAM-dependent methyltransferase